MLILRVPYHGLANKDGAAIGGVSSVGAIRAADFRDYADAAVDIAEGLGEDVCVLGLSAGGVMTASIAQNRDVDRAVVIAPAVTLPGGMPDFLDAGFRDPFSRFPNVSLPSGGKLYHACSGVSTRPLAEMYALAKAVQDQAAERPRLPVRSRRSPTPTTTKSTTTTCATCRSTCGERPSRRSRRSSSPGSRPPSRSDRRRSA